MPIYEIVLKSFNGGTDETDHLIKWFQIDTILSNKYITILKKLPKIKDISLIDFSDPLKISAHTIDLKIKDCFENYFYHCGNSWIDIWSCACNDECPVCEQEIEPYDTLFLFHNVLIQIKQLIKGE